MTRDHVKNLLKRINQPWNTEDVNGINLRRAAVVRNDAPVGLDRWFRATIGGIWRRETWRLQGGGGIAGNTGMWWLVRLSGTRQALGPASTQKELARIIRLWRRWELP